MINQHPSAFAPYLRAGWKLVPISSGTKGPQTPGWNNESACINASSDIPSGYGAGLAHAYSGTCAIDLDDLFAATLLFAERGLDLNSYLNAPDAVQIVSGRPGSGKLIYRLWMPLPSKKLNLIGKTALEFRCATANNLTVQDLLPPSAHPSGTTYQWGGKGNWQSLPALPQELMNWWMELISLPEPTESIKSPETQSYDLNEMGKALSHIDPDCDRKTWIECLMALKYTSDPGAYNVAKDWSEQGQKYPGDRDFAVQWKSLKNDHPSPITPNTLYKHAKDAGYIPPPPDVSNLFTNVTPADPDEVVTTGYPIPDCHLDLMPAILRDYAREVADSKGASPVIAALSGMVACSAVADARSSLTPKLGMEVPPVLWAMGVADPSAKKTQVSAPMFAPLQTMEQEDIERYRAEMLLWKGIEARHNADMKAYESHCANPLNDLNDAPTVTTLPGQPVPLRFRTQDSTSQKLAYLAAERPYGIACIMDEASGWLNRVTDSRSGDNRSTWTASYDAEPHYFDRVGAGSLYIERLAVPIYCNVQPDVITKYMQGAQNAQDDGFLQRFIPALVPDSQASRVGVGVPEYLSYRHQWEQSLRQVFSATKGGKSYRFDFAAETEFCLYEEYLETLKAEERLIQSDSHMRAAMGKLLGQTARIAFIWHLLEDPNNPLIGADLAQRAITWSKAYLIPALRYFYAMGDKQESLDKWVADHILTAPEAILSVSDVSRSARRVLERMRLSGWRAADAVQLTMDNLVSNGWLAPVDQAGAKSPRYAVNPKLREQFADKRQAVARIRQARIEEVRKITRQATGKEPKERWARGLDRSVA